MEMFFGVALFLLLLSSLWLILKIGDFIERYFPALWARMGDRADDDQRHLGRVRRGGLGFGGGDGGGGG